MNSYMAPELIRPRAREVRHLERIVLRNLALPSIRSTIHIYYTLHKVKEDEDGDEERDQPIYSSTVVKDTLVSHISSNTHHERPTI